MRDDHVGEIHGRVEACASDADPGSRERAAIGFVVENGFEKFGTEIPGRWPVIGLRRIARMAVAAPVLRHIGDFAQANPVCPRPNFLIRPIAMWRQFVVALVLTRQDWASRFHGPGCGNQRHSLRPSKHCYRKATQCLCPNPDAGQTSLHPMFPAPNAAVGEAKSTTNQAVLMGAWPS